MPKISIIIPVYNVEPYLRECLDSVRNQTFTDWECICVDDGSTDASPAILDEYAAKDSRFRSIKREHSNAGACRNAGLDVAKGEYLSFLDSDDVFSPKMLGTLLNAIETSSSEIATCEIVRFSDGDIVPKFSQVDVCHPPRTYNCPVASLDIFTKWVGRAWDKMFRKKLIDNEGLRFQEIRSTNDARFTYSALSLAKRVVSVSDVLVAYRESVNSLERTRHLSASCIGEAIRSYASEMNQRGVFAKYPSLERFFKLWAVNVLFWNMDTIDNASGYIEAHTTFSDLCVELRLDDVLEDCPYSWDINRERFEGICKGFTPIDSLLLVRDISRKELMELRPLRGRANSKIYRVGLWVTWPARKIKSLLNHWQNMNNTGK